MLLTCANEKRPPATLEDRGNVLRRRQRASTLTAPENLLGTFTILMTRLQTRPIKLWSLGGVGPRHQDFFFLSWPKDFQLTTKFKVWNSRRCLFFSFPFPVPPSLLSSFQSPSLPPSFTPFTEASHSMVKAQGLQTIFTWNSGLAATVCANSFTSRKFGFLVLIKLKGKIKGLTPENPCED